MRETLLAVVANKVRTKWRGGGLSVSPPDRRRRRTRVANGRFEVLTGVSRRDPVRNIAARMASMEAWDHTACGSNPLQGRGNTCGVLPARLVVVWQKDDMGATQGLGIALTPFPCTQGIRRRGQSEGF